MFYAIEYAYGSAVVNNGNRADKIYEFTAKRLRDAWVAAGPPNVTASGYRAAARARDPLVRSDPRGHIDGDGDAWYVLARERVDSSPALARYRDVLIETDWADAAEHYRYVATEPERVVARWARDTQEAAH